MCLSVIRCSTNIFSSLSISGQADLVREKEKYDPTYRKLQASLHIGKPNTLEGIWDRNKHAYILENYFDWCCVSFYTSSHSRRVPAETIESHLTNSIISQPPNLHSLHLVHCLHLLNQFPQARVTALTAVGQKYKGKNKFSDIHASSTQH